MGDRLPVPLVHTQLRPFPIPLLDKESSSDTCILNQASS